MEEKTTQISLKLFQNRKKNFKAQVSSLRSGECENQDNLCSHFNYPKKPKNKKKPHSIPSNHIENTADKKNPYSTLLKVAVLTYYKTCYLFITHLFTKQNSFW